MSGTLKQNPADSAPCRQKHKWSILGQKMGILDRLCPLMPPATHTQPSCAPNTLTDTIRVSLFCFFFQLVLSVLRTGFDQPAVTRISIYLSPLFTELYCWHRIITFLLLWSIVGCAKPLHRKCLATRCLVANGTIISQVTT